MSDSAPENVPPLGDLDAERGDAQRRSLVGEPCYVAIRSLYGTRRYIARTATEINHAAAKGFTYEVIAKFVGGEECPIGGEGRPE
jgi:hypothetical protein